MRTATCLQPKVSFLAALTLALLVGHVRSSNAQESGGVIPASHQSGSFFNQKLGTALRFNYHTQGYGTQDDVFSLGGMKVFNMDDATVFVDGQGTLSDDFGGGFNLGVGYRQLTTTGMSIDPQRILGLGFWTDGQSTSSDNFFTQLGFSLESLGDSFDLRLNGSFPLERTKTSDAVLSGTGTPFFLGNNIFGATEEFTIDTAHTVVDGEFAKRINNLEAWAFVGGYQLGGGGVDATGYRAGVRGYAIPDLALSLQVTDDDVYATNVMFGVTWFIGRTNKCNGPCGTLLDRFREPVQRNDFIAMTSRRGERASGNALTDAATNDVIQIVHINGNNTGTGDGSIENPYGTFTEASTHVDNDILLVHSGTTLTDTILLKEGVRLLGEGQDPNILPDVVAVVHQVDTNELGLINLPEAVALDGVTPTINAGALAETFTMGDGSTVNNFIVNGGTSAVVANGIAAPTTGSMLANLELNNQTGDAISLDNVTGALIIDNSVLIEGAGGSAVFVNGGTDGMTINAGIVNTAGASLTVQGRTGGIFTYGGTIDDDGGNGILVSNNADSTIDLTNASTEVTNGIDINTGGGDAISVTGNTNSTINFSGTVGVTATGAGGGANRGIVITGNDVDTNVTFTDLDATALDGNTVHITDAGTMTFSSADDTRTIANTGTGSAFFNDGAAASAILTVNSNVENSIGGSAVRILNRTENDVIFNGTVNDDGGGLLVMGNTGGTIDFTQAVTTNVAGTNRGIDLDTNTDTTIMFNGVNATTTGTGIAFRAVGGGTLLVASPNTPGDNTISTQDGIGLDLQDMIIDDGNVTFEIFNVSGLNVAAMGINLRNLTTSGVGGTGQVILGGTDATHGGQIATAGTAINVDNVANVSVTNLAVSNNNVPGINGAGVVVTNQAAGSVASFTDMDINTRDADAVNLNTNADGVITFSTLAATTDGTGDGIDIDNVDGSTVGINVSDATINAAGTGRGFAATGGGTITMTGTNTIDSVGGTAFEVTNAESLTASNVTIANTGARGVVVKGLNTATDSVTLTNFDVTTTTVDAVTIGDAVLADTNTDGTVALNSLTAESGGVGNAVVLLNNTGATVNINGMDATATGSGAAFTATAGGTLSATGTNNTSANTGQGLDIQNMTIAGGGATFADVDVTAGTGTGVLLNNNSGGRITVNGGTITTDAAAISVAGSEDVAINGVDINNGTSNGTGIAVTIGAGDTFSMSNVDVESGTSTGIDVDGGTFTATGTNTVTTTTGTGLFINSTTIGGGGASFSSVDVNGAANGIALTDLTGGQFRVGGPTATGTDGAGGTLTTTGTAILVTGVSNAVFNDVTTSTGGAFNGIAIDHTAAAVSNVLFDNLTHTSTGTGNGVFVNDDGAGELDFTLRNSTVDVFGANSVGFNIMTNANAGEIDIRLDNNVILANNNSAVAVDLSAGTGDVQFLVSGGNDWSNNSATDATASFLVSTDRTLNATIGDQIGTAPFDENRFANSNAGGTAFDMEVNSGAATISLDLRGNNASGNVDYLLTQTAGAFGVVELADTVTNDVNNTGLVDIDGGNVIGDFIDLVGPIKQVD